MSEDNEEPEKDNLHRIFKELKVGRSWNENKIQTEASNKSVQELWDGKPRTMANKTPRTKSPEPSEPQSSDKGSARSKTKTTVNRPNPRVRPYPADDKLPQLGKLSLARDECTNKNCQCNTAKAATKDGTQQRMNYARLCSSSSKGRSRNYIQEAHLKLHNKNKDTRQLIRAAHLQLIKKDRSKAEVPQSPRVLPTVCETQTEVFGQNLAEEGKDFAYLVAEHLRRKEEEAEAGKKNEAVGGVELNKVKGASRVQQPVAEQRLTFKGASFGGYRAPSTLAAAAGASRSRSGYFGQPVREGSSSDGINLRDLEEGLLEVSSQVDLGATSASGSRLGSSPAAHCPLHPGRCKRPCTCSDQARLSVDDLSVDELAGYFDDFVYIPRKMSKMAEMMYT